MEEELDLVKRKNDLQQVALKVETYIAKTKNVKDNNVRSAYFDYIFENDKDKVLAAAYLKEMSENGDKDAKRAYKEFKKLPIFAQIVDFIRDMVDLYKKAFALMIENMKAISIKKKEKPVRFADYSKNESAKPRKIKSNEKYANERRAEERAKQERQKAQSSGFADQKLKSYNEGVKARGKASAQKSASQMGMGSQMSR